MLLEMVKNWMQEDRFPRWWVIVGALASIAITQGIDLYKSRLSDERQQFEELRSSTTELQVLLAAYVDAVLDAENSRIQSSQDRLREELISQQREIDLGLDRFSAKQAEAALRYRDAMAALNLMLPESEDFEAMGRFWVSAAELIETRDNFLLSMSNS